MAIYRLLREASFDPEETAAMSEAYELALRTLRLVDRNDPKTELIAARIIALARGGIKDPATLSSQALADLERPF